LGRTGGGREFLVWYRIRTPKDLHARRYGSGRRIAMSDRRFGRHRGSRPRVRVMILLLCIPRNPMSLSSPRADLRPLPPLFRSQITTSMYFSKSTLLYGSDDEVDQQRTAVPTPTHACTTKQAESRCSNAPQAKKADHTLAGFVHEHA
jgi:hypothetical protein